MLPSCDVTVIIVEPTFLGVILPLLSTVATDSSLDDQVTILFVAVVGLNVTVNVKVLPNSTVFVFGNEIPSRATSGTRLSTNT